MTLSGQVPLWTAALFTGTLILALLDVRPFANHVRESALLLLGCVIVLWAMVATDRMDLVVAACACAALLTAQRMLSAPGAAVDQQVALAGLLMLSGGAALSADLGFLPCLFAYTALTGTALALGEVERAGAPSPVGPVVRAALLLSLLAVAGGAVFFFSFPRLSWNLAARRGGGLSLVGAVTGLGDRVRLGGSGELKSNPRIVFRAELSPDPGVEKLGAYWVAYHFDNFDGLEWRGQARPGRAMQRLTFARAPRVVSQTIELLPAYGSRTAVALDHPVQFLMATAYLPTYSMRTSLVPMGDESVHFDGAASGFRYHAFSVTDAMAEEPDPSTRERRLELPPHLDARIPALARELAGNSRDPAQVARRVEQGLLQRYRYTLELPGPVQDPLADFLFQRRAGHCEDFATALAVLLRTLGIPTRVVTGFFGGERTAGEYVVRAGDAHAWVEADVAGSVLRLDATPPQNRSAASASFVAWLLSAYESLEVRWLNGVVDYSFADQMAFLKGVRSTPARSQKTARALPKPLLFGLSGGLLAALLLYVGWRYRTDEVSRLGTGLHQQLVRTGLLGEDEWLEQLPKGPSAVPESVRRAVGRYLEARFGALPLVRGERRALLDAAGEALRRPRAV
jgi:protein-glutamine gamma-glutamyltransferase